MMRLLQLCLFVVVAFSAAPLTTTTTHAFQSLQVSSQTTQRPDCCCGNTRSSTSSSSSTQLWYEPKWKKKATLAEQTTGGQNKPKDFTEIGLKGDIPVVFKQGNLTKQTMAIPGQPLRDVATQAGQFIKYGCGKGECGTCECLVNGQWIRPCSTSIPAALTDGQIEYVVTVKEIKNKSKSSGKFYSVRSFIMGFYNNLLGMVGFVRYRKNAANNWKERQEYEDLIRQKTLEKKRAKQEKAKEKMSP